MHPKSTHRHPVLLLAEASMLELMSGLLGAPNERIWPGMKGLPNADKYRLPPQPFNYLRKVGAGAGWEACL